jgi:hypothetical protein
LPTKGANFSISPLFRNHPIGFTNVWERARLAEDPSAAALVPHPYEANREVGTSKYMGHRQIQCPRLLHFLTDDHKINLRATTTPQCGKCLDISLGFFTFLRSSREIHVKCRRF